MLNYLKLSSSLAGGAQERRCSEQRTWESSAFIEKSLSQQFRLINIHGVADINCGREDKHLPKKSVTGQFCGGDLELWRVSPRVMHICRALCEVRDAHTARQYMQTCTASLGFSIKLNLLCLFYDKSSS